MIKILYAEDELSLGKIVSESLESRGFEVHLVSHGNDVIPEFQSQLPEICVLDVMLPGQDGFSLGKEIHAIDPDIPIIFLTARSTTNDVIEGFRSGGNDYIKKPFSIEELIVRINNLIGLRTHRPNTGTRSTIEIGQFLYYPNELQLAHGKQSRLLSHRENELLKYLINHQQNVIERNKILQNIWGDDHYFNSRNLDVYIRKLRTYLEADPNIQIITLKGVGYRFVY